MRRSLAFSPLVALVVLTAAGCGGDPEPAPSGSLRPAVAARDLPPPLRALDRQSNQLLGGGPDAFKVRIERLRGFPIVVNQWASWCGPCRQEFPFFQRLAAKYAGRVAFLGVNSQDSRDAASTFLAEYPVPYPHYYDENADIARVFEGGRAWPTTAFYNATGKLVFTHLGGYRDVAALDADVRRYALNG